MSYVLLTDSTVDIKSTMAKELGLDVIPLKFTIEGETYSGSLDYSEMPIATFYSKLRSGSSSSTSQINTGEFDEFFEKYLKDGKNIIYLAFSSGLSGTYQSAKISQKTLSEKYPERKIIVCDTLCASMGEGLLVYLAAKKKQEGMDIEELASWVETNKLKLCHWFTVDDLHHLKRGGRVSAAAAVVGTMLGIKPVLHVDNEGHLIPMEKIRGRKQALNALVKKVHETAINPSEQTFFISHGDCIDDANYVKEQLVKEFKPKAVKINYIGPVIGAHSGPGTIALFFLGEHR